MQRLIVSQILAPEHIERIIQYIGNVPVSEGIYEFQYIIINENKVKIFPFDMNMDIIILNALAVMRKLLQ
jgi:hypothetical protein